MTPNQITIARVAMGFLAVAIFASARGSAAAAGANLLGVALILAAIALDAVDGYVARRKRLATPLGAQLDILGDRVLENLFFTYFAVCGLISLWVPVVFFVRGTATDFLRSLAAAQGREGFGRNSMLETQWGRALVASRASRASYGVLKCVCFCWLGLQLALLSAPGITGMAHAAAAWAQQIILVGQILVALTVSFCLIRGIPVLWEGRGYLRRLAATPPRGTYPMGAASR